MFHRQTDTFARFYRLILHGARHPHFPQPAEMRCNGRTKSHVGLIVDSELLARLFDERRKSRIVDVTNSWKQMVFDLKIQPTDKPREQTILSGIVDRCLNLMY